MRFVWRKARLKFVSYGVGCSLLSLYLTGCAVNYNNVGVEPTGNAYASKLSGGQQRSITELQAAIKALDPSVDPREAQQVAYQAVVYPMHLSNEYGLVWPPSLQNVFVNTGRRSRGLCYQWTTDILIHLRKYGHRTLDFHWAIAKRGTRHEHNTAVVSAKGKPLETGIILDPWRNSGNLYWLPVTEDKKYDWVLYKSNQY